jgi:hypothetical protein
LAQVFRKNPTPRRIHCVTLIPTPPANQRPAAQDQPASAPN